MSYEVLLLGLLVGCVNYCFRYLPLRLGVGNVRPTKRGATGILLDTIGITSICALLVVSTAPEVMHDARRFVPTLVGFVFVVSYPAVVRFMVLCLGHTAYNQLCSAGTGYTKPGIVGS